MKEVDVKLLLLQSNSTDNKNNWTDVEQKASRVFADFDASIHAGLFPISFFEEMSDASGEGFYGEEYDAQVNVVDPFQTGRIIRSAFLAWYTTLVKVAGEKEDGDDASVSLDTADREGTCRGRRKGDEYALF